MSKIELIETINPPADAMCRQFHCHICDKQHLQTGIIARIWVLFCEGHSALAALSCYEATK
jgi:hypothetical protein